MVIVPCEEVGISPRWNESNPHNKRYRTFLSISPEYGDSINTNGMFDMVLLEKVLIGILYQSLLRNRSMWLFDKKLIFYFKWVILMACRPKQKIHFFDLSCCIMSQNDQTPYLTGISLKQKFSNIFFTKPLRKIKLPES